jgi:6-phosphogluconolactonase (cycloisomerase 2 family)
MKLSLMGRVAMATLASLALGLGMSACGGGTIGFMWVLGQQYNQITGFKIDDFTGNLTQIIGSPFASHGVNPASIVVLPGGRYVYVVNSGTGGTRPMYDPTTCSAPNGPTLIGKEVSGGVSVYSVGGDGVLTFQQTYQSQGNSPVWAQADSSGTYLYVLDKYSPDKTQLPACGNTSPLPPDTGSITAFRIDASTGRLTLLTNSAILYPAVNGSPVTFFNVGVAPTMMKVASSCLLTLDSIDGTTPGSSVFPYTLGSGGQLATTTTGSIPTLGTNVTSINANGGNVYLTDAGANRIIADTVTGNCNLSPVTGSPVANITGTANPAYSLVDNTGKYLYVLNQANPTTTGGTTTAFSTISAFVISPQITPIAGSPYKVGSNPVCMVEDPSGQYIYVSNRNDGTLTGELLNPTTGELSDLTRGSTFPASGLGSCLVVSGSVD